MVVNNVVALAVVIAVVSSGGSVVGISVCIVVASVVGRIVLVGGRVVRSTSQLLPSVLEGQVQLWYATLVLLLSVAMHVPPFKHGLLSHAETTTFKKIKDRK